MCRWLLPLILLISVLEVSALESIKLVCKECKFEKTVGQGTTKLQFYEDGLWGEVFFCKKTGKFVELRVVKDEEIFKKSKELPKEFVPAKPTDEPVEKGSIFKLYTHPSCSKQLVPLDYYKSPKKPVCPICSKGILEFETLSFSD